VEKLIGGGRGVYANAGTFGSERVNRHQIARQQTSNKRVSRGSGRAHVQAFPANCSNALQPTISRLLSQAQVEIIKRFDQAAGFVVLAKRWVVERPVARRNRCRRLGKD
jgi:hypothetical protein